DVAGRLVGDQQLGPVDHRPGDCDPLLFTARERRRAGAGAVREPDPGEHFAHWPLDLFLARPGHPQRQRDIVERGQMANQPEILEHDPDPPPELGEPVARGVGQILAEQSDAATGRSLSKIEQLQERGLARARWPREKVKPSLRQPEVEVAQNLPARAVAQADAVEFGNRRQNLSPPHMQPRTRLAIGRAFLFTLRSPSRKRAFVQMILTCPNCGTQYVVKDGAIPPQGRQVRCASCKHSWHQNPEEAAFGDDQETLAEATMIEPRSGPEAEERAYEGALASEAPDELVSDEEPAEVADAEEPQTDEQVPLQVQDYDTPPEAEAQPDDD